MFHNRVAGRPVLGGRHSARAVVPLLAILGCGLSEGERAQIDAWLSCDHCERGERASVLALGDRATAVLSEALRGPPADRRDLVWKRALLSYEPAGAGVTQVMYAERLLGNYVATYQKRAASALGGIRTSGARRALQGAIDSADVREYRSDALREIHGALELASYDSFTGRLGDTAVAFGDTIGIRPDSGLPWDGDEWVTLNGSPFPDSLVIDSPSDSLLRLLAVGYVGRHVVSLTKLGRAPQSTTQVKSLFVTRLRYRPHTAATAPLVAPAAFPQTRYLALRTAPGDTTDLFRFSPSTDTLRVTAAVEAPGVDPLTVAWYRCSPFALFPPGPPSSLSGRLVTQTGSPVAGVQLTIGGVVSDTTDSAGQFAFSKIPAPLTATDTLDVRVHRQGFRIQVHRVQAGARYVEIGLVAAGASEATARSRTASTVTVVPHGAGGCLLLQVRVARGGGPRIIRLRLTSP